ncbi:MAG: AIR carboxylase family protein [Nanoarchaeota archaeon]
MLKVLVIFGSKSDEDIYNVVIDHLKKANIKYDLRVLSAHRTPDEVEKAVKAEDFSVVIAGAGLSAALPGVVASKTLKPVIGIPVHSNYQGLDALLSIMQMPPGIPVLSVGVNKAEVAAEEAVNMLRNYDSVTLIGPKSNEAVTKAISIFNEFGIKYKFADKPDKYGINIEFTFFDEPVEETDELVIYVPLMIKKDDKAEAALNILKHSNHGLWVGLNRGDNAALAAIEIMNLNGKYEIKLKEKRISDMENVLMHDKKIRKK